MFGRMSNPTCVKGISLSYQLEAFIIHHKSTLYFDEHICIKMRKSEILVGRLEGV